MVRPHILLVEADETLRDALTDALLEDGYLVTAASGSAAAARALLLAGPEDLPHVCILDTHDDGAVMDELRSDPERYGRVGLVTLSFGLDPCPQADVDLRRPYKLADLEGAVETALTLKGHGAPLEGDTPRP